MAKKLKILISEDEQNIRNLLKTALNTQGYETFLAEDGQEAIDLFPSVLPDAILMDLMMPRVNGMEAIEKIRQMENGQDLPIIVLTALEPGEWEKKTQEVGANIYMTKPFRPKDIIHCFRSLFENNKTEKVRSLKISKDKTVKVRYQTAQGFLNCYLKNLMDGRSYLQTDHILPLGSTFRFEITPPKNEKPFWVQGTVRWINLYSDQKGMGIQFTFDNAKDEDRIHRYVMQLGQLNKMGW